MTHPFDDRLKTLGLERPKPVHPQGSYVSSVLMDNSLYISGQIPIVNGSVPEQHKGCVGRERSLEEAQATARICALNILAHAHEALSGWDRLERLVKLTGFVYADPDFTKHPFVINAASDLLVDVLGPHKGPHARSAVGVASLPLGVSVEIEALFAVKT
jgi:enamine deaminase RidA (YjgF/YER057c/UK114 family)